jgi:probable HAF family extracellular repeat protein
LTTIVGDSDSGTSSSNPHACLWHGMNVAVDLGTLPGGAYSTAFGVNLFRTVVGNSGVAGGGQPHAFVWTEAAGMQDLNALIPAGSGWLLTAATGINVVGQICGYGTSTASGQVHAYLLTPQ